MIVDLITKLRLPSQCLICHSWSRQVICPRCEQLFLAPSQPRCRGCAGQLPPHFSTDLCGRCLTKPFHFDAAFAAVNYQQPWSRLIANLKFNAQFNLAAVLAQYLKQIPALTAAITAANYLIPIPLAKARLQQRGYNQATLLANALAKDKTKLDWLRRIKHSQPLHLLRQPQRLQAIHGAFVVATTKQQLLEKQQIMLVDDVMTSGATLNEAAKVLKLAGAAKVNVVVFARTSF